MHNGATASCDPVQAIQQALAQYNAMHSEQTKKTLQLALLPIADYLKRRTEGTHAHVQKVLSSSDEDRKSPVLFFFESVPDNYKTQRQDLGKLAYLCDPIITHNPVLGCLLKHIVMQEHLDTLNKLSDELHKYQRSLSITGQDERVYVFKQIVATYQVLKHFAKDVDLSKVNDMLGVLGSDSESLRFILESEAILKRSHSPTIDQCDEVDESSQPLDQAFIQLVIKELQVQIDYKKKGQKGATVVEEATQVGNDLINVILAQSKNKPAR